MVPEPKYRATLSICFAAAIDQSRAGRMLTAYAAKTRRAAMLKAISERLDELVGQLQEPGFTFGDEPDLFGDGATGVDERTAETLALRYLEQVFGATHSDLDALAEGFTQWIREQVGA